MDFDKHTLLKIRKNGERFWVQPTEVSKDGWNWKGLLRNNLVCQPGKVGDQIEFTKEDIIEKMIEKKDALQ